jgi:hypothetical protein
MKNFPNLNWPKVWHPGRIYKEWFRLKPEYGEQLNLARADFSDGRKFFDDIRIFVNLKFWQGWFLRPQPLENEPWHGRFAGVTVALPFYYKAEYEWCQMGQHKFKFDFRFLNVLYIRVERSRDLTDEVALRFKRRYGKDVHPYARIQTEKGQAKAVSC